MARFFFSLFLVMAVALCTARADDNAKKPANEEPARGKAPVGVAVQRPGGQAVGAYQGQPYGYLPGYWSLRSKDVQDEVGLSDEQKEKLKEIGKKYGEQMREAPQQDWAKIREMSPEERRKKYAEMAEKRKKQAEATRKQIEELLKPKQLEVLKAVELRRRGAPQLLGQRVADHLGLSDEQKQKLRDNRQQLMEDMQELQGKSNKKALEMLTPEQLEKLKKLHTENYRSLYPAVKPQAMPKLQQSKQKK